MAIDFDTSIAVFTVWGMRVLSAVLILVAGWMIGNYAKDLIAKIKKLDETLKFFLGGLAKYAVLIIALITVLGQFGVQTASLIAVLGAAGLAIGLAMQGTLGNVAAGVMLLILRPFNVGDHIEAGTVTGTVRELGLFGTEMSTLDNIFIFVPNGQLWNSEIRNFSRNLHRRQDILVGISYEADINTAFKAINRVLDNEDRLITTTGKEPQVMVGAMGAMAVDLIIRVWTTGADLQPVKSDLTKAIKETLDNAGIAIPSLPHAAAAPRDEKSRDNKRAA